ncbi:LytR/AlgR family response regulator transcription factor [Elizabethkingia meningoseptica]|uniref:LytR/AlgR family response regulator transcription factor n=1 Tax=Elizabethkingia meningoseptica TaxID=238 RepID=UPI0038926925
MISVAIIEDEPAIRKEISYLVQQEADTELIGWSDSVQTAVKLITEKHPDVILMDIQLCDGTAFDVLRKLSPIPQNIIFITAYNHFAIKAIKYGALDYLLKPVD